MSIEFMVVQTIISDLIMESQPLPQQQQPSSDAVYFNLEQDKPDSSTLLKNGLSAQARSAFIVKVYFLLTLELLITFGMCLLSQYCLPFREFQLQYQWVIVFPILLLMASMFTAMCVPAARAFPLDMGILLVFILSFSYLISFSCSIVLDQVPGPTVVIAIGSTVAVVLALTLYAVFCKANFLVYLGIIIVVSLTMVIVLIVALVTFAPVMISIYCGLVVIIYGIYLVIITKMIIGGEIGDFPMDNYVIASILLYVYIMKIFLMILRIVANAKR